MAVLRRALAHGALAAFALSVTLPLTGVTAMVIVAVTAVTVCLAARPLWRCAQPLPPTDRFS